MPPLPPCKACVPFQGRVSPGPETLVNGLVVLGQTRRHQDTRWAMLLQAALSRPQPCRMQSGKCVSAEPEKAADSTAKAAQGLHMMSSVQASEKTKRCTQLIL